MGRVARLAGSPAAFAVTERNGQRDEDLDGAVSDNGAVVGTMLHGLFENASVRATLVAHLRRRKGLPEVAVDERPRVDEFDRLAEVIRGNVNMDLLWRLVGR